jgi:glucoamylase
MFNQHLRLQCSRLCLTASFVLFMTTHFSPAFADGAGNQAQPQGEAPHDGALSTARWSSAVKDFFGTAYEAYDSQNKYSGQSPTAPISKVWFTGSHGALTEVFWPTADTAQVIDSQFLVSDGSSFLYEERRNSQTQVVWLEKGVPAYKVTNTDPEGRFVIEKTVFTDPDRDVVVQHVKILKAVPGLKFYYLHKPSVGNTPLGNSAFASMGRDPGMGLYAYQGDQAQALLFSIPLKEVSASFSGLNDGYQDLARDYKMDFHFESATLGNVALMAWVDLSEDAGQTEFDIALGFGASMTLAHDAATQTLAQDQKALLAKYTSQWKAYQGSIRNLGATNRGSDDLFRASVAVIKSMEDKTNEGAFVASPTVPWGEYVDDTAATHAKDGSRRNLVSGYHVVWPRDLYQMATTMMAIEDYPSAIACLNRLRIAQFSVKDGDWQGWGPHQHAKDGAFPQNFWANGESNWQGLQMDEVSMPIILAYRLWQDGKIQWQDYWDMIHRAADFIQSFGPWSPQERWEEMFGASPSTISAEISALWVAAAFAKAAGDDARVKLYQATGDAWAAKPNDNIDTWTFTHNGPIGDGHYYVRMTGAGFLDEPWNADAGYQMYLANNSGRFNENQIVDGGFLELVRFGVKKALDTDVLHTMPAYDASIRVDIPGKGPGFRRYLHDRYNRDDNTGNQTDGMLWPLLTGERGHYELEKAVESNLKEGEIDAAVTPYLNAIQNFATASLMIPEQVWDAGPGAGASTGSATPLGWSHAEYLKLLRSAQDRAVFDRLPLVTERAEMLERRGYPTPLE